MARFSLGLLATIVGSLLSSAPSALAEEASATQWADQPMKLITTPQFATNKTDLFTTGATHMCLLHNAILRGYNSIYLQAPHVRDVDKADFVGYALTWHKFVQSHHDDEEATLFTKVEELLGDEHVFDETHKEHESFLGGLAKYQAYLSGLASPAAFSGEALQNIMLGFQQPFEQHFHAEIATIAGLADHPRAPAEGTPEAAEASDTFKAWGKKTVSKAGNLDVVPFFLFNLDASAEDGRWASWPPMPAPIRWGLINVGGAWHAGWWRFASCDASGNRRELYALRTAHYGRTYKDEL